MLGWSHQIREGKPGDRDALPSTVSPDVAFHDGVMWDKGVKAMSYDELARPPAPAPRSPQDSLKAIHVSPGFTVELAAPSRRKTKWLAPRIVCVMLGSNLRIANRKSQVTKQCSPC